MVLVVNMYPSELPQFRFFGTCKIQECGLEVKSFGLSLGLTLSGIGLDLSLMASGLGLIEIGLVVSNTYSAHDIN